MQQQQPGTATHSCICSSLISWHLTRPRGIQLGLPAILKQLTSYLPVSSDNNYVCYECVNGPEVGVASQKILECASCPSGWTPLSKFLDPPLNAGELHLWSTSILSLETISVQTNQVGYARCLWKLFLPGTTYVSHLIGLHRYCLKW